MKNNTPQEEKTEFSRIIKFNEWLDHQSHMEFQLVEHEKKKLEQRLDVGKIHQFSLSLKIKRIEKDLIDFDIDGIITAEWENHKGEIFTSKEDFKTKVLHSTLSVAYDELLEDVEYTEDGIVDVGEIATQYLIIMIDEKYADLHNESLSKDNEPKHNPFSILKNLKDEQTD